MKRLITFLCITGLISFTNAQNLEQRIESVNALLQSVETGKVTYSQSLRYLGEGLAEYRLQQTDSKGRQKESLYRFNWADIDPNTVRSLTKKDVILVQLLVGSKQKLIQVVSDNGDKITYANEVELFAENGENGADIEKAGKELIPFAVEQEENRLALNGYEDHMNWLAENILDIELPKKQIAQKVELSKENKGNMVLEQSRNEKNRSRSQLWELNLSTLNANSVNYRISGDEFWIEVKTRRNIKGIRFVQDGEQKNYSDDIRIYAKSISNGKDIYKVLKAAIPLAEEAFEQSQPKFSSTGAILAYLNKVGAEVAAGETTLSQSAESESGLVTVLLNESEPDKATSYEYQLHFGDVNPNSIDFDGQKDRLYVELPIKKSVKFIRVLKDGEVQNYTSSIRFYFNKIEEAIIGKKALRKLAELSEQMLRKQAYSLGSVDKAVADLNAALEKVTLGDDAYELYLEVLEPEVPSLKLASTFSNLKKSIETIEEFSLKDLNEKNMEIDIRGKHVVVELNTNYLEKIVKTYVDGEIKPYRSKVEIESTDVQAARRVMQIFEALAAKY